MEPGVLRLGALDVDDLVLVGPQAQDLLDAALGERVRPAVGTQVAVEQVTEQQSEAVADADAVDEVEGDVDDVGVGVGVGEDNPSTRSGSVPRAPGSGTRTRACWWKP